MPGAGPIILFDKSVLHSLSVDESVWFDTFYFPCITPLFFVETLADLEKEVQGGRSPEDVVGNLAEKTPVGGAINIFHHTLSVNELLGQQIQLDHRPIVPGGNAVKTSDRRRAVIFESPPETEALTRWENRDFLEVERRFAKTWRESISAIDLDALFQQGRELIRRVGRPQDLQAAKAKATELLQKSGSRFVADSLLALKPEQVGKAVLERWRGSGSPPIHTFAPYTAHLLTVDLFFCIGLGSDLIGRERPTNKVDIAYLYYLPFCMAFTSRDRLHERTAPLFLDADQVFVRGDELKADLAKLDSHYSNLSDEEKLTGVMSFAHYPPVEGDFLTSRLWDRLMRPEWREWASNPPDIRSPEEDAKIVEQLNELAEAPTTAADDLNSTEEPEAVMVKRKVRLYRGKWRMLPPEVEKSISGS